MKNPGRQLSGFFLPVVYRRLTKVYFLILVAF